MLQKRLSNTWKIKIKIRVLDILVRKSKQCQKHDRRSQTWKFGSVWRGTLMDSVSGIGKKKSLTIFQTRIILCHKGKSKNQMIVNWVRFLANKMISGNTSRKLRSVLDNIILIVDVFDQRYQHLEDQIRKFRYFMKT